MANELMVSCPICSGDGILYEKECNVCAGTGKVSFGELPVLTDIVAKVDTCMEYLKKILEIIEKER